MQAPLSPVPAPSSSRSFRRTALAAVGLTAAASLVAWHGSTVTHHIATHYEKHRVLRQLQEIPSLKLHFHVKRDSMKIHSLSEFDVFANPVIGTLENDVKIMTYDGIAEFEDSGIKHKYILANGVAYHTTQTAAAGVANEEVSCMNGNTVPPIHDMLNAINDAQPATVAADSPQQITCASGKLLKLNFAGDQYLLCPEPNASGFTVFGTDFDIAVQFLNGAVDIPIPELSEAALSACESVPSFSVVQPSAFDLLSGAGKSVAGRMLQSTRPVVVPSATCGCKGKHRPCIFFHGLNQKVEGPLSDSSTYFGKLGASAPCCTSIKYAQIDTVNQGWNEDAIQKKVCDLSLSMSSTSNAASKTIEDTIIVAHSMGNMMLAGAIATGKCSLSSTSTWVALASPTRGSMGSDFLQNACSGNGGLISLIAPIIGQCPANKATKALAYESEKFADATLKAQYDAAQIAYAKNVGAAMCSDSYNGLSGGDQLTYRLGGTIINHKSRLNDGIVEYQSCVADLPTSNFKPTYESAFYTTKVNHMDMTFRNGDSMTNNQQKPVKWFECLL